PSNTYTLSLHDALPIYLLLEWASEAAADTDTADGRPATMPFAHARMSRMLCGDPQITSQDETLRLSQAVMDQQLKMLSEAINQRSEEHTSELQSRSDLV